MASDNASERRYTALLRTLGREFAVFVRCQCRLPYQIKESQTIRTTASATTVHGGILSLLKDRAPLVVFTLDEGCV